MSSSALRRAVSAALGLAALTLGTVGFAQATLMTGLGGPRGYGASCMPPNDDGSYPLAGTAGLDLTPAFPSGLMFYRGTYTRGWINNNGSLSFNSAISTYTPAAFPGAPQPMIAPYWADTDTRIGTTCNAANYPGGGAYPPGTACTNTTGDTVWWSVTAGQLVITWDNVGYFECTNDTATSSVMDYQMILSTASSCGGGTSGMDFDIEFRYHTCGWDAGTASGGATNGRCAAGTTGVSCTPAQAGFDSGPPTASETFQSLPGSRTDTILNLCTGSNLTPPDPGVWRFGVRGGMIMCPSAGTACDTGMHGICANGALSCTGTATTTCVPFTTPQPSQCNGLDNDCDGNIDTGPCPSGQVCDGSSCVPMCVEGACFTGQTCNASGLCEDTACIGVTCPSGQRCVGGSCVDACSGVTCPLGQVCRLGSCVDPCAGITCGTGAVCNAGVCQPSCPCTPCATGQTCAASGLCVDPACAAMTCSAGQVCQSGSCVDACTGAVCPSGQMCTAGNCVMSPVVDAGTPDAGNTTQDSGNTQQDTGAGTDASTGVDARAGDAHAADARATGDGSTHVNDNAGCACRTTLGGGTSSRFDGAAFLAAFAMIGFAGRRRRTRARSAD